MSRAKDTRSFFVLAFLFLFSIFLTTVLAQEEGVSYMDCEINVVVQSDDWLSKIAEKYYGDFFAYPVIVKATNVKARTDSSYTVISNADIIEPGWKLCVPPAQMAKQIIETQDTPVLVPIEYSGGQFIWEWPEGTGGNITEDWYFDILIYPSANAPEPKVATLVSEPETTDNSNGRYYSDPTLTINLNNCAYWGVRIAVRNETGEFDRHISPESIRLKIGDCGPGGSPVE
jgi:hypothetical protein